MFYFGGMNTMAHLPFSEAMEAIARDLEKLDVATAKAVIEEARRLARAQWLRLQIRNGEDSGEPLDGPATMSELLAEADSDVTAAALAAGKPAGLRLVLQTAVTKDSVNNKRAARLGRAARYVGSRREPRPNTANSIHLLLRLS